MTAATRTAFAVDRWLRLLVLCLALGARVGVQAQRQVDDTHPEGRWEVLDRCRLSTNAPTDGDSFRILHRGREYGVRLYFVDCPETDLSFGERIQDQAAYFGVEPPEITRAGQVAAQFTAEKLSGHEFTVQTRWQNALGRGQVARFYCEVLVDGRNLAEELVANGLARVHGVKAVRADGTRAANVISQLKNRELTAREQRLGLWDDRKFPRAAASGTPPAKAADKAAPTKAPVDLNRATYEELQTLPGVGPKLAERIISRRPFGKVDELEAVPGIGPKTVERLRPLVRVDSTAP
jgi:competence protein ComEA